MSDTSIKEQLPRYHEKFNIGIDFYDVKILNGKVSIIHKRKGSEKSYRSFDEVPEEHRNTILGFIRMKTEPEYIEINPPKVSKEKDETAELKIK